MKKFNERKDVSIIDYLTQIETAVASAKFILTWLDNVELLDKDGKVIPIDTSLSQVLGSKIVIQIISDKYDPTDNSDLCSALKANKTFNNLTKNYKVKYHTSEGVSFDIIYEYA